MKICINAGHCPRLDSGAVGQTGLQEAVVAHDISQLVMYYLQQVNYDVLVVQENELYQITDASNAYGADLFVSIHCNASDNPQANGTEIFTTVGETKADRLAICIMDQFSPAFPELYVRSDYVDGDVDKESNFYVLRNTDCPAVLIELAFISNPKEEAMLADPIIKDKMAAAIARGISDYCAGVQCQG